MTPSINDVWTNATASPQYQLKLELFSKYELLWDKEEERHTMIFMYNTTPHDAPPCWASIQEESACCIGALGTLQ